MTVTYVDEHVKKLAESMIFRYGNVADALRVCKQNIDSPLTEEKGKKFWGMVYEILRREAGENERELVGRDTHAV